MLLKTQVVAGDVHARRFQQVRTRICHNLISDGMWQCWCCFEAQAYIILTRATFPRCSKPPWLFFDQAPKYSVSPTQFPIHLPALSFHSIPLVSSAFSSFVFQNWIHTVDLALLLSVGLEWKNGAAGHRSSTHWLSQGRKRTVCSLISSLCQVPCRTLGFEQGSTFWQVEYHCSRRHLK